MAWRGKNHNPERNVTVINIIENKEKNRQYHNVKQIRDKILESSDGNKTLIRSPCIGTENVGMYVAGRKKQLCSMKTHFGGVWSLFVLFDSSSCLFGFALVVQSPRFYVPGIIRAEWILEVVMCSWQRNPIIGMVGTVSFMRMDQRVSKST